VKKVDITMASFLDMMVLSPKSSKLDEIAGIVKWERLRYRLNKVLDRSGFGPSGYDVVQLFKALVLQNLYGLSDPGMEEMLYDRLSFRRFCGFGLTDKMPDETTLCRFRGALSGKTDKLFQLVMKDIESKGIELTAGTIVDASVIKSSTRPPRGGEASTTDPEAGWTKKSGDYIHGYKAHVASCHKTGLIKRVIATSADVHDSQVFGQLLEEGTPFVTADKAYDSKVNRDLLHQHQIQDGILYRGRANKQQPHWQKHLNKLWSKTRSNIERIFGHLKTIHGLTQTKYKGWVKNQVHLDLLAMAYNMKRAATLLRRSAG
jgi:IS5 family transposase